MNVQVGGSLVGGCLVDGCRVGERRGTMATSIGVVLDLLLSFLSMS